MGPRIHSSLVNNDDVIKWKHFPWLFVRGIEIVIYIVIYLLASDLHHPTVQVFMMPNSIHRVDWYNVILRDLYH